MRELITTPKIDRSLRKFTKRNLELQKKVQKTLEQMKEDVFAANLDTHKLGDFDICGKDDTVDFLKLQILDPVLLDFKSKRAAQKAKYGGELFLASFIADGDRTYLEFFQIDRNGEVKGIVSIDSQKDYRSSKGFGYNS